MDRHAPNILVSILRASRTVMHLFYGMILAVIYPRLDRKAQRRIIQIWSRQLLAILEVDIRIAGNHHAPGDDGCLVVANHVSWLDIFVLNSTHPSRFIAKSEVRDWPIIGWLGRRCGTVFIDRASRQNALSISRQIWSGLLQGECIALFPEGTTTDGKHVGHFHSALMQPAIDSGVMLCPIALRYHDRHGELSCTAPFIGDTTLLRSIWNILRCSKLIALVAFTPGILATGENRRILARTAQTAIALELRNFELNAHALEHPSPSTISQPLLSAQSAYALLVDPQSQRPMK
jgi:1-acyl-sn-glycerol-3-phosphate acyltransferase